MGFLSKFFGPSKHEIREAARAAEARERARIQESERRAREAALFAQSEGGGVAEETNINLFDDDFDEPLAVSTFRGSGKVTADLII